VIIRWSARCAGALDRFCHIPGPNWARIDFRGVDLVWGGQKKFIKVLIVVRSILRARRYDDGVYQVIDAFVGGRRWILPLDPSKLGKN
jgi:hypothetical protein